MCGENFFGYTIGDWAEGITPACAGKTNRVTAKLVIVWDHPRMCGENGMRASGFFHGLGSPPHVRGKQSNDASLRRLCWITPACAGKTRFILQRTVEWQDHPRMCGENPTYA